MRKWIMICMVLLLLCGCTQQPDMEQIAVAEDITAPVADESVHEEPPYMLSPNSLDDLKMLFQSVDWPDEMFEAYINNAPGRSTYAANGIYEKEDVTKLKDSLSAVIFPILSNAELIDFTITPEYDDLTVMYDIPSDDGTSVGQRISFRIRYGDSMISPEWARRPQGETYFTISDVHEPSGVLWHSGVVEGHRVVYSCKDLSDDAGSKTEQEILDMEPDAQKFLKEQVKMVPLVWYIENQMPETEAWEMRTLQFNTLEELGRFFESEDLEDEEFREYILGCGEDFAWVQSQTDVDSLKRQLSGVPYPLLSNAALEKITFNFDAATIYVSYILDTEEECYLDFEVHYRYRITSNKNKTRGFVSTGEHKTTGFLTAKRLSNGYELKYIYRPNQVLTNVELLRNKPLVDEMLQANLTVESVLSAAAYAVPQ